MCKANDPEPPGTVGTFVLTLKLGEGSFGSVYAAKRGSGGAECFAAKLERLGRDESQREVAMYKSLQGCRGVARLHWYGRAEGYDALVLDRLGPTLEALCSLSGGALSLRAVLDLADQMLTLLQRLHEHRIVHRDVKPSNFCLGRGSDATQLYIIDFGLARKYVDRFGEHIQFRDNKSWRGTPRYASISAHLGLQQSRRDDLESLCYVLMYLRQGQLPWSGVRAKTHQEVRDRVRELKISQPVDLLCQEYPREFATYLQYCRSLRFEESPDYAYLRKLFRKVADREGSALREAPCKALASPWHSSPLRHALVVI